MDGEFYGAVLTQGRSKPFLLASSNHTRNNTELDPSLEIVWPMLKRWTADLVVGKSEHLTFSDLGLLLELVGYEDPGVGERD
jgi:hypothetical protein